jgi:hypothetical protein
LHSFLPIFFDGFNRGQESRDAPAFVEVREAGDAVIMLCGVDLRFNVLDYERLGSESGKRSP